jgi:hypothetical protein
MPSGAKLRNICVTLHRRGRDFTEEDRQSLALLSPHFSLAYQNAIAFAKSRRDRELLTSAFATQRQETVFLDQEGKPCPLSARLQQWVDQYFPGVTKQAGLPEPVWQWMQRSQTARESRDTYHPPEPPLRVNGPEGRLDFRMFADEAGHRMLLVTEKRSLFGAERLARF